MRPRPYRVIAASFATIGRHYPEVQLSQPPLEHHHTTAVTALSAMDFAPYQDTAPETTRALSPSPQRSSTRSPNPRSPPHAGRPSTEPFTASSLPAPSHFSNEPHGNGRGFGGGNIESGRLDVSLFETSLPIRLDHEAMLAYLLLPPAGGVLLLVAEHKSDYVRYVMAEKESSSKRTCWERTAGIFGLHVSCSRSCVSSLDHPSFFSSITVSHHCSSRLRKPFVL